MAWVKTIDADEAEGALKEIYQEQKRQAGAVANILQIHSLAPDVLAAHLGIYKAAMQATGELSRARREMIAVAVSQANGCHYWVSHHGAGLLRLTKNKELVDALSSGKDFNGLSSGERAMLSYARKLTTALVSITEQDIQRLRNEGFSDRAILEINLAAAYVNFVNRIAEGLGVELEPALDQFRR